MSFRSQKLASDDHNSQLIREVQVRRMEITALTRRLDDATEELRRTAGTVVVAAPNDERNAAKVQPGVVRHIEAAVPKAARRPVTSSAKKRADLRRGMHNALRIHASQARSLAKFGPNDIVIMKQCKDFDVLVEAARKAGETWIELHGIRLKNFRCSPKKMSIRIHRSLMAAQLVFGRMRRPVDICLRRR